MNIAPLDWAVLAAWRVFREDLAGFGAPWILVIALVAATAAFLMLEP
jgi:hypothetical protein